MDANHTVRGKISRISRIAVKDTDTTTTKTTSTDSKYSVYVDFEPDDTVRMDMTVMVHLDGTEIDDPAIEDDIDAEEGH